MDRFRARNFELTCELQDVANIPNAFAKVTCPFQLTFRFSRRINNYFIDSAERLGLSKWWCPLLACPRFISTISVLAQLAKVRFSQSRRGTRTRRYWRTFRACR